jgi:N-glycosylase/DNA lyase
MLTDLSFDSCPSPTWGATSGKQQTTPWEPRRDGLSCLRFIWDTTRDRVSFPRVTGDSLLAHFYFCLLGGFGISYELNASAYSVLYSKGLLNPRFLFEMGASASSIIERELARPQFLPLTTRGRCRRYRYPASKSRLLVQASHWLATVCDLDLEGSLNSTTIEKRNFLISCPGFGYKTASWFLRNTGYSKRVAVIDVHLMRVLIFFGIIPPSASPTRDYVRIEKAFLDVCDVIGAEPSKLDLILWAWERGTPLGSAYTEFPF